MSAEAPISKRLKEIRKRTGLTQQQLGVLAGMSEDNASAKMNQYEKGVHIPRFPRLKDLAKALNVPTAFFYTEEDEIAEMLYQYGKMTKKDRKKLLSKIATE